MKIQPIESDWDCLVILDACRCDHFEDLYRDYLMGDYARKYSRGYSTTSWLDNTFKGEYDFDYFSCNPYINSQGFSLEELSCYQSDWKAKKHFNKIHNLWNDLLWEEKGAVRPQDAVNYFLDNYRGKKSILHLIQPHTPYLNYSGASHDSDGRDIAQGQKTKGVVNRNQFKEFAWKRLPMPMRIAIKKGIGKERTYWEQIYENGDGGRLHELYRDNLKRALEAVNYLRTHFGGELVVSADHGELLGECRLRGHHYDFGFLHKVPYLEVGK